MSLVLALLYSIMFWCLLIIGIVWAWPLLKMGAYAASLTIAFFLWIVWSVAK